MGLFPVMSAIQLVQVCNSGRLWNHPPFSRFWLEVNQCPHDRALLSWQIATQAGSARARAWSAKALTQSMVGTLMSSLCALGFIL